MDGVTAAMVIRVAKQEGIALRDGHADKGSRNRIPGSILQRAVDLLREKQNAAEVSRIFPDLSHSTLGLIARREGIALTASLAKGGGPHLSEEKRRKIAEAVKLNPNAVHVADTIGNVSATAVRAIARQQQIPLTAGLATKFRSSLSAETRASIVASLLETPSAAAVARQFSGITEAVVRKIANREQIELHLGKASRKMPNLPPEAEAMIVEALRINSNAKAVARQIEGATYMIVRRLAKKEGIDLVSGRTSGRGDRKLSNPRKSGVVQVSNTAEVAKSVVPDIQAQPDPPPIVTIELSPSAMSAAIPLAPIQRSEKSGFAIENLVRALNRAQTTGDRERVNFLVSNSDHDLLRAALDIIRASKAKSKTFPSPRG